MKYRLTAMLAAGLMLIPLLAGCSARPGTAPNEVLTLSEVPKDKMLITMRGADGIDYQQMELAIEKQFPEIELVITNNTPTNLDVRHDHFQDIFLSPYTSDSMERLSEHFMDLSGQPFTGNYRTTALNAVSSDGKLYFLPGPSDVYGIVYDKDLFEANGWALPKNLDEFITLCQTIEATGIRALQPSLYYSDAARQFFMGFNYQPLFAGVDNFNWLQSYKTGKATMAGHIEPGFETMKRLINAGVLRADDFDVQPKARSNMLYRDHTCAMILETQMAAKYNKAYAEGQEHRIGMMPFYSGGEGSDYLLSVSNFYISLNKNLEENQNKQKLEKVLEIVGWLSTEEGQSAIMSPETPMISSLKSVGPDSVEIFEDVAATIQKEQVVPQPFWVGNMTTQMDKVFRDDFEAWVKNEKTVEALVADCDKGRDEVLKNQYQASEAVIGQAEKDFSILETSAYFAELFKNEMDAEIGLCLANTRNCGNNIQIYQGDIEAGGPEYIDYVIGRCFKTSDKKDPDKQLKKIKMTGKQILDALNNPPEQNMYKDIYYTAAGLKIEFSPWAGDGNRVVSVSMADGTALEPDREYTVAAWKESVRPEYITAEEQQSDRTAYEIFETAVKKAGTIKPFDDDRFTLNWEVVEGQRE